MTAQGSDTSSGECNQMLMFLTSAFGFILYVQGVGNRQRTAIVEGCLAVAYAILIFFPSGSLSYVVSTTNNLPICVFQLVFSCLLAQSIAYQITRNSVQPEVVFSTTVVNILTRCSLILCALYGIQSKFVLNLPCMLTLVILLPLVLGDFAHLFSMSSKSYLTIGDPISWHVSVDAMSTFFLGCCALAFPDVFCEKMTESAGLLTKALGIAVIGQSLLSFASLCFRSREDAIAILKSKLVMYVLSMFVVLVSAVNDKAFWSNGHPFYLVGTSLALLYNAGYALSEHRMY
ncbi:uncharacterized protein LOC120341932 [Styela clava]